VDDTYEVCGQTIKSLIWLGGFEKLVKRISYRNGRRFGSHFLKGGKTELQMLMAQSQRTRTVYEIVVVQPGISRVLLPEKMALVLAASDEYIKPRCQSLRVMASA